jgi:hypothetical protein
LAAGVLLKEGIDPDVIQLAELAFDGTDEILEVTWVNDRSRASESQPSLGAATVVLCVVHVCVCGKKRDS